jgi:putative transposase
LNLAISRIRDGSYFPSLPELRRLAERSVLAVVSEGYVAGVPIRRVEDLVEANGTSGSFR